MPSRPSIGLALELVGVSSLSAAASARLGAAGHLRTGRPGGGGADRAVADPGILVSGPGGRPSAWPRPAGPGPGHRGARPGAAAAGGPAAAGGGAGQRCRPGVDPCAARHSRIDDGGRRAGRDRCPDADSRRPDGTRRWSRPPGFSGPPCGRPRCSVDACCWTVRSGCSPATPPAVAAVLAGPVVPVIAVGTGAVGPGLGAGAEPAADGRAAARPGRSGAALAGRRR